MKFSHLHVHSHYSLLDGLSKIDQILDACQELKMDSVALTDHGTMYGVVEFFQKAKKRDIKPIIGCEVYIAPHSRHQKRPNIDVKPYHLVLLVKDQEGYSNLVKLVTKAHLEGFYYKPRIDKELLKKHSKGLIGMSACLAGEIPRAIVNNKKIEETIEEYHDIFGENFYLELQRHPELEHQEEVNQKLIEMGKKLNISLVATNDTHYLKKEDAEAHDVLLAVQTDRKITDQARLTMKNEDYSFRSQEEMIEVFKNIPEAIANTQKIAEQCNFEFQLGVLQLPYYQVPTKQEPNEYLKELCYKGLSKRYPDTTKDILDRLEFELSVINKMGFASYFLIVQDFINWAKSKNIVCGPGRGCFLPDTKILLKTGEQKNIQDIKPNERIISALGNKRKVKKVLNYDIDEKIVIIKCKMPVSELKLTTDHKILTIRHKMCPSKLSKPTICKPSCETSCKRKLYKTYKLQWIQAKNLKKNDLLAYPIVKHRQIKNFYFDLLNFNGLDNHLKGNSKYVWYENGTNKLIQKKVKRYIKLDKKLARLLGFYIAEGWNRTRRKYREATIGFGFNKGEKIYISSVRKLLKQVFGLESNETFHKTRNSCQIHAYSRIAARFLERLCGKYSENKHIPYQIFGSSDDVVITLLTSLFQGDGSNKDTMRMSFDSISLNLVSQIKMLLARLGIISSIKIRNYKKKNWRSSYKLTISGKQLFKFDQLFKEFPALIKKQKFYRNDSFIRKNYIWFPVKDIFFQKYKGKVYDLTIEKDKSYIANEIAVHNSAAGSIVSYLLNITTIDPLKYDLLFERFLNPDRISMPDIDLDFADERRSEVIDYVSQKYGRDHVAQIITFGTMAARGSVRDAGRAMDFPYDFCDRTAKMIPFGMSINQALEESSEFKQYYDADPEVQRLVNMAMKLEGVARHASTHAAGVLITKDPLDKTTPCQFSSQKDNSVVSQYEMHAVEDLGLLKMDFLGLKTLTVIQNTLSQTDVNLTDLSLNDEETFKLIQQGNTTGVFQLESGGFKRYLKELRPTQFEDIIAMVALYRPGPMEFIPEFIARKHGLRKIAYLHPGLEPILKSTYGICVYQEQLMHIARELAGFTPGEADVLRKAVGKKIKELLDEQKTKMIEGMIRNKIDKQVAIQIWQMVEPFAQYGFNKAHATCYALIGYQTAYLKAHYPAEFMSALITSDQNDIERIAFLVEECKTMGIEVLPPNVNESFQNFAKTNEQTIRFGLKAIKNVGHNIVQIIVEEREQNGPFQSIADFIERTQCRDLNKKSLESLVRCGALDFFGERAHLLASMDQMLSFAKEIQKVKQSCQVSLFGGETTAPSFKLTEAEINQKDYLSWEKELLGLYVSEHPLNMYQKQLQTATPCRHLTLDHNGRKVIIGGIINTVKKIITKTGQPMIFAEIEDLSGRIEAIVFPSVFQKTAEKWQPENIVMIGGKLNDRDGNLKILCDSVKILK